MTEVCNSVMFDERKEFMDYTAVFQACTKPRPTCRMREGGSFSGTMGQTRQRSAQLCKIDQLLTRLGPLFVWPSACQSMHCGFATPHVPEMQAVGCRMQSLSSGAFLWGTQGVWERPWGWISWFILMFNSWYSFHLCRGFGSITQGSAPSEYRQWLLWLLNCFDCVGANACSILNEMAFVCVQSFKESPKDLAGPPPH